MHHSQEHRRHECNNYSSLTNTFAVGALARCNSVIDRGEQMFLDIQHIWSLSVIGTSGPSHTDASPVRAEMTIDTPRPRSPAAFSEERTAPLYESPSYIGASDEQSVVVYGLDAETYATRSTILPVQGTYSSSMDIKEGDSISPDELLHYVHTTYSMHNSPTVGINEVSVAPVEQHIAPQQTADGSHRIQTGCIDSLAPLPDMEDYRGFGLSGTVSPNATYHSVCKQSLHGQSSVSSSAAHRKGAMSSRSDNDADTGASPRDSFFFSKDSPSNHNSPTQPPSVTDSRYNYAEGDLIAGEYLPQGLIGTDLDSTQVHACHQRTGEAVMLKIKHAIDVEVDPELAVYDSMKDCSATIRSCFHQLICTTFHGAHRVLVLEGVGPSLQEYLLYNHMRPFCDRHVREIARQLVCGLKALHDLGYAHLNIRPSSVFFRDGQQSKLMYMARGIQFAPRYLLRSAELVIGGLHQAIIVNEHLQSAGYNGEISIYEAPELTIKAPWSPAVDSFSLGCLLFELVHDGPRHQQNTARVISRCIEI